MPVEPGLDEPLAETHEAPLHEEYDRGADDGPYVVILYNDDHHGFDEVIVQVQKATGYPIERCVNIMLEAHARGRSIAFTGDRGACDRAAGILRQIRLQVETDRF